MTKLKYYEVSVDNDNFAVVEATSPGQAKNKFINGNVVPFFAGYDNFDCEFTEVRVRRLKKLDRFEPDDDFHILKTLIKEYGWTFGDGFCEVDDDATEEEIKDEAADIAFEHFGYSFWEINEEHEDD